MFGVGLGGRSTLSVSLILNRLFLFSILGLPMSFARDALPLRLILVESNIRGIPRPVGSGPRQRLLGTGRTLSVRGIFCLLCSGSL